jgi:hypothetical protein
MEENNNNIQVKEAQWKAARKGIIFFSVFHFLFEIITDQKSMAGVSVAVNYGLTSWYIWRQIDKGKINKDFELKGFLVSLIIFLIRFVAGILFFYFQSK